MAEFFPCCDEKSGAIFENKQLLLAALTLGNVPQIALDLLLSGKSTANNDDTNKKCSTHAGVIEHDDLLPIVGSQCDAGSATSQIASACEVHTFNSSTVVVQRRSPTRRVKGAAYRFARDLVAFAVDNKVSSILLAYSASQGAPHAKSYQYVVSSTKSTVDIGKLLDENQFEKTTIESLTNNSKNCFSNFLFEECEKK
mmetsp:Transcript_9466/g.16065  ORF Transcript_9466/g.16065 Transcript_9466/m.16065 type:complete len:198 (-) Transcript_9466:254-847(-)